MLKVVDSGQTVKTTNGNQMVPIKLKTISEQKIDPQSMDYVISISQMTMTSQTKGPV